MTEAEAKPLRPWDRVNESQAKPAPPPHIDPAFPNVHRWDNGLVLYNDFITKEEEAAMIAAILEDDRWTGAGKRLSLHFGPRFDYTTFATSETENRSLPNYITNFISRLPIQEYLPDQFTVQYYPPGVGIPPHVDTHSAFREALYSLSFGSTVPMAFKRCGATEARRMRKPKRSLAGDTEKSESLTKPATQSKIIEDADLEHWELFLPPRSLLLMMGPSRYGFTHKIRGRKFDQRDGHVIERQGRYSITMRSVKRGDEVGCNCDFPEVCDAKIREEERQQSIP
ncbi:2OG-Fe oxygenase family protein [Phlyctema vagabunda]|uniref:2OG-Fe oxygenase family protein n=1 Tax=Phlyctema vagabunda TaxID=108571 RepID=A0ABR4P5G3_9HELO